MDMAHYFLQCRYQALLNVGYAIDWYPWKVDTQKQNMEMVEKRDMEMAQIGLCSMCSFMECLFLENNRLAFVKWIIVGYHSNCFGTTNYVVRITSSSKKV